MADMGPGEVMEHFRGDLLKAETKVGQSEAVEADAAKAVESASQTFEHASRRAADAIGVRESKRNVVIAALEALDVDPGDQELCSALMQVKGKSDEEIRDYFAHQDRLREREQPIVIVRGAGELATPSTVVVIFGQTVADETAQASLARRRHKGDRGLQIPFKRKIGFGNRGLDSTGRSGKHMFAGIDAGHEVETVEANPDHPFEEVHFASSAIEVEEIADVMEDSDTRERTDQKALEEFGVPTLVAYGGDAVRAVAARVASRSEGHNIFTRRSIEEIGLPPLGGKSLADMEISDELSENLRLQFYLALSGFMNEKYSAVRRGDRVAGTLEFLAPLQDKIGLSEAGIVDEIKRGHSSGLRARKGANGKYVARTQKGQGPRARQVVRQTAEGLAEFGVSVSPDGDAVKRAGYELEIDRLDFMLRHRTMPLIDPIVRHRLKRDLREMRLAALPLAVSR